MRYQVLIVATWLALPLAVLLLLRADFERYQSEVGDQLSFAQERHRQLLQFSAATETRAYDIENISDTFSREGWEVEWDSMQDEQKRQADQLGDSSLSHFAQTRDALDEAAKLLDEQQSATWDASRAQDSLLKAESGIDLLAEDIYRATGSVRFYAGQNNYDGWLWAQSLLAQLEQEYDRRQSSRLDVSSDLRDSLRQAASYRHELVKTLSNLPGRLAVDQGKTYREDLGQRFIRFDIRRELRELVMGDAQAEQ